MSTTGVSSSTLAGVPLLAGADAEALEALAADAYPRRVLAGEWLIREGDDAEDLYVVLRGRLRAVAGVDADRRTLRVLGPGAAIGELALLTGSARSASVQAVRDSTLLQLGRGRFVELMERDPRFAAAVARELAAQLQASGGLAAPPTRPALIALRRLDPDVPLGAVASSLARALSAYGPVEVLDADGRRHERRRARRGRERARAPRRRGGRRRLERPLRAPGRPDAARRDGGQPAAGRGLPRRRPRRPRAVVGRSAPRRCSTPSSRAPTTGSRRPSRATRAPARLARRLVGRALGVVLSGGGARGFAHIGALAELEADGIEVDRYGGCSMGSFIAAMAAAGWSPRDIRDRCHEELVRRSPFNDYTLPRVALIRSRKAARMFDRLFGELTIEELAKPLFTVSADLLSSRLVVHRRGSLTEAVGASMSIPGLVPPLSRSGRLLVDGGVLNNLPIDAMADSGEGPIVAVDVVRRLEASAADEPPLPSIMETLSRATVLGSVERAERNRELALLVITPETQDIPLRDFRALDRAVEAGRAAARAALDAGAGRRSSPPSTAPVG